MLSRLGFLPLIRVVDVLSKNQEAQSREERASKPTERERRGQAAQAMTVLTAYQTGYTIASAQVLND